MILGNKICKKKKKRKKSRRSQMLRKAIDHKPRQGFLLIITYQREYQKERIRSDCVPFIFWLVHYLLLRFDMAWSLDSGASIGSGPMGLLS